MNPAFEPDTFAFRNSEQFWWVLPYGQGGRSQDGVTTAFDLSLCNYCYVERLVVVRTGPDPILLVQETDMEGAGSFAASLAGENLSVVWKQRVGGFNLAAPLVIADTLYVAAFDFVGKLNLVTGRLEWFHDGLYRSRGFNAFSPPVLEGDTVVFTAERGRGLRVHRREGHVIN